MAIKIPDRAWSNGETPTASDFEYANGKIEDSPTIDGGVSTADCIKLVSGTWETAQDGNAIYDGTNPVVSGQICTLTGLTAGYYYYAQSDGSISTTENVYQVGYALSTTALLVAFNKIPSNYNHVINGNFQYWQRKTTQSASGFLSCDRFATNVSGSSTSVTQGNVYTAGISLFPQNVEFYYQNQVITNSGAGDYVALVHPIPNIYRFVTKTVTISFWAKAGGSVNLALEAVSYYGATGGGYTAQVSEGTKTCTLTTSWQYFTFTVDISSSAAKTIDVDESSLKLIFWMDAGSTYNARTNSLGNQSGNFFIAQVKCEVGSYATPFQADYEEDLFKCRRFFQKSYDLITDPGTATLVGRIVEVATRNMTTQTVGARFSPPLYKIPTVTLYSTDSGTAGKVYNASDKDGSASNVGESGFSFVTITGGTTGDAASYHYTANAELDGGI